MTASSTFRSWSISLGVGLGLALLASSFAGALSLSSSASPSQAAPDPVPGSRAVAVAHVDVDGGVTPLFPLKVGQVVAIDFQEGQEVSAGAVLFRMDDTAEKEQVAAARADLAAAQERVTQAGNLVTQHSKKVEAEKAAIKVIREDVEVARLNHKRLEQLYQGNLGSNAEEVAGALHLVTKAENAVKAEEERLAVLESADPQGGVRLAEQDVKAKTAQLKRAEYALSLCAMKAPTEGRVLRSLVSVGETLGSSSQKPALLFAASRPLIVRAEVEQEFARFVQVGQEATIQDDATGGGNWKGKVRSISNWYGHRRSILLEPQQFNDVRTLECILTLESEKGLRIGQRVRVFLGAGS